MPPCSDSVWKSVRELFNLPWFRRVWIIQEIVGAPYVKIICSNRIINWNDLYHAVEIIDHEFRILNDDYSQLTSSWAPFLSLAAQREWEARQYRWSLLMLLENFRYVKSTLSRDRLFALLGLASDGNEVAFEPDYESPLEVVVLRFARVFVGQGRGMQILYRAGLSSQSERFPSWIPDWTVQRPSSLHNSSEGGVSFSACGPQEAKIDCNPDTDELIVEGYDVDIIASISTSPNMESEWEKYFNEVDEMVDSALLSPVQESCEDLKWKVPVAGVLYPKVAVSGGLDLKQSYKALRSHLYNNRKGKSKENYVDAHSASNEQVAADSPQKQSASYIAALQDTLRSWRFIVTKRGYLGVVPNLAQVGDCVTIFKGGLVPFIVHKSETRQGAFRLIGECYVHGIMNGEGLLLPGVAERRFCLH